MKLSTIFEKPIDRHIEGVIKADDEASLGLEVEEYVLTNEVAKRLENFLYAYNNYEGANGVWISGFFGSGKSHLLKILALLLENRSINGKPVIDMFLPKCGDNEILKADLRRAIGTPSQSILFNIDQKAVVISKTQFDALVAVFVKVFDEMCGYYGKQGHIAQFERDLDKRGQYDAFREAYRAVAGKPWETGREQALLEVDNIANAYAQATDTAAADAHGVLDKYRTEYKVSIEDFAKQVNDYIEEQDPDFRLNFYVDEVGQYIADNVKLMTNLQTIAESLATKSRGRAWLIVTAQEELGDITGEMEDREGTDFSKIQARFANRMKLTSADVAEVIQKRLLLKNEQGIEQLSTVYAQEHNNFKTLFDFADGAQTYRNFRDRDHFIHTYPFIPYQFALFQASIRSLSLHNAFEGKHSSVGERSMLGVFQQVAMQIANRDIGQLATFDLMFEGIHTALKAEVQHAVMTAERHLDNPFAVKLLKALFLVKYVKEFNATVRNLTVLMLPSFDADLPALRERIEEALNLLEQQTYIQRNGDKYEFLTNEEKDVEEEIKNTEVEASAVAEELGKLVFDYAIKRGKIRYDENGQDYPYTRKLDDRALGREYELAVHVISPFHEQAGDETVLRMQAMGRDELLVIMPPNDRLVRDLLMLLRTDKYVRQNISVTQQESVQRILRDKQYQNQERRSALRLMVADLLSEAKLVAAGHEVEVSGSDPQTRIVRGFHELLVRTYPNLTMLRGINYTEEDLARCLQPETTLFGDQPATYSEAEQEMLAFVNSNNRSGLRTTMKNLVDRFERKPYGWYLAAIQCILAKLYARGKIEVRQDGNILEGEALERALGNTLGYGNMVLEPQMEFTAGQIRLLRDFYTDFFDAPPVANEAKALGQETAAEFRSLQEELVQLREQAPTYPFLTVLDGAIAQIEGLCGKPHTFYLTDLSRHEDALYDQKAQVLDPVRRFMSGPQKAIYDEARQFLADEEPNFSYVDGEDQGILRKILENPRCFEGNQMQQAKTLLDGLQKQVRERVSAEKRQAIEKVDERWRRLAGMSEFAELTPEQQKELEEPFDRLKEQMQRQSLIAVIRDVLRRFDTSTYPQSLAQMTQWAQPVPSGDGEEDGSVAIVEPRVEYVAQGTLDVAFEKAWLADEADVEAYLSALKKAMLESIRNGKRIQV